jgi:hypothetical protein
MRGREQFWSQLIFQHHSIVIDCFFTERAVCRRAPLSGRWVSHEPSRLCMPVLEPRARLICWPRASPLAPNCCARMGLLAHRRCRCCTLHLCRDASACCVRVHPGCLALALLSRGHAHTVVEPISHWALTVGLLFLSTIHIQIHTHLKWGGYE